MLSANPTQHMLPLLLLPLVLLLATACNAPSASGRADRLTYVALGASDAVGVGARDPLTEGWVPRFGASLGDSARVINLGVSGSTLGQALTEQLGPALDAEPDLVTVWLVVNDLNAGVRLEQYTRNLDQLLGALAPTGARVLLGNVPDLARVVAYRGVDATPLRMEVERWNAAITTVAERHGAQVVDLHAHWRELAEHPEYLSTDGFHPSSEGYARLAEIFAEAYAAPARS